MGKTKEKTWMLIIETKSYRGLSSMWSIYRQLKENRQILS